MNKTVLVIEDEAPLREALKVKLQAENMIVLEAKDGAEGMQLASQNKPDLILLDVIMPKMNGLDVLKGIKNNTALLSVPIFVLTNLTEESSEKAAKDLGAEEYLIKSNLKIEDLVLKIKTRLGA